MIAIIGGGITGLAAAHELTRRGIPFTLFEASPRAGGLIHTDYVDGFTIEAGADSILVQKPAALALCGELGLGARLIATNPPRTAFVLKNGRLHALPSPSVLGIPTTLTGVLRYDLLPWPARARLAIEPFIPARKDTTDESVAAFFSRRFGAATATLVAEPLLGGIHAGNIDALSMHSLFPRFVEAEGRHRSVIHGFKKARRDGDGLFRSLVSGMGELVRAIEASLLAGSLRYDSPVDAVRRDTGAWRVAAGAEELAARAVIMSTPAFVASRLLRPIDEAAATLCAEVPYVCTASVALAWPRRSIEHPFNGSGFVVARAHARERITACTWVSSKWSGRAPANTALLRAFIGGAHDPEAVDLSDAELVDIAVGDVSRVLRISGPPTLARVYRWRQAGAQHNVGQLARIAQIESRLAAHPGLFVAGSGFRSVGIPDCVADGRAAAADAADFVVRSP